MKKKKGSLKRNSRKRQSFKKVQFEKKTLVRKFESLQGKLGSCKEAKAGVPLKGLKLWQVLKAGKSASSRWLYCMNNWIKTINVCG